MNSMELMNQATVVLEGVAFMYADLAEARAKVAGAYTDLARLCWEMEQQKSLMKKIED